MTNAKAPYYESRFLRANAPDGSRAIWLRETLLLPTSGAACADVWVMVFDPAGHRAHRQSYPVADATFGDDPWAVRIGPTSLDDASAAGTVPGHGYWELTITPGGQQPVRVLSERAYRARIPTAKTLVRHPQARVDGRLLLDGADLAIDGWTGSVNHNWGTRHTPAYAYGQVCAFDDAPDTTLEIVTARAALGRVLLPGVTLFVLRHAGLEFAVRSISGSLQTHGRYRPFTWTFGARLGEQMIEGEITTVPADVIGLTYPDTHGGTRYCYNSSLARCRIQLAGRGFTRTELTSRQAMFEILTDDRLDDVPLLA